MPEELGSGNIWSERLGCSDMKKTSYHEVTSIHMSKHVRRTKHELSVTLQLTLKGGVPVGI
jgi:hypothetical protein